MKLMFFIIGQKINNLLLKTNIIFNYKIGIIGFLFYLIIFLLIKSPIASQINWNNWMLFILFTGFLLIDGTLFAYDYVNKIKSLEKSNEQIKKSLEKVSKINETETNRMITNLPIDYETTTELETTQQD